MFTIAAGSSPKVTHGQLRSVILTYNAAGEIVSGDVEFHEGFQDAEEKFVSLGVDHIHMGPEMKAWAKANAIPDDKGVKAETWLTEAKAVLVPVKEIKSQPK